MLKKPHWMMLTMSSLSVVDPTNTVEKGSGGRSGATKPDDIVDRPNDSQAPTASDGSSGAAQAAQQRLAEVWGAQLVDVFEMFR